MNTAETLISERTVDLTGKTSEGYTASQRPSLRDSVEIAVNNYFQHLEGQDVTDVYEMVMSEVETPLLEVVMKYTRHNQTKAAQVLGLNRGTLRKKLKQYGLL
ncbi:DNA-binding transcriptional regulator Fis [Saccharophagus sp. K07]|jgi:Fis family transcriptional regulator|uniref:DNA-binding transcriptional regulator Fis n=1 Tax=Saccharophagus sp. K07 TaxID=2283636 RepID=UPI001651E846|nr:DNA-binding transcriptional regulator Fis [Saccharophagus sp. K07]MBC6905354.1 DNA-binding transcriptional regulator Fis [Saccharophagus sp. K07]